MIFDDFFDCCQWSCHVASVFFLSLFSFRKGEKEERKKKEEKEKEERNERRKETETIAR